MFLGVYLFLWWLTGFLPLYIYDRYFTNDEAWKVKDIPAVFAISGFGPITFLVVVVAALTSGDFSNKKLW